MSFAGRPIGQHIRNICALLEEIGPSGQRSIAARFPEVDPSNVGKYCSRAVGLGLITVVRGNRCGKNFSIFTVAQGWRELADQRRTTKPPKVVAPIALTRWHGVSSVFQMGA